MTALEEIKKALEGVTPERVERLWWFLHILAKSTGTTNAEDDKWNWINAFCTDYEDDTFNLAAKLGFISVRHDSFMETSTARITKAGMALVAHFDKAPSAALTSTLESLQRENEKLRKALLPFAELPDNAHGKNRYFLELLVCPDGDTPADGVKHYGEAIRTARTALSAQVQDVAGWQPIETAPKDGTPVILWTVWVGDEISPDPFSEVQIGYWDHGNDLPESHDFSRRPEWVVQRIGEPTHWLPLPAAPAKQEG
ncbi:hypothetical protein V6R98_02225 [Agrobacterium sp. CCNWLW71]|uniref:hypothetical protein n=1 Tax=unclassified Agrobacterium TaxID=2632611 RepID=UPI002FF1FA29